MFNLSLKKRIAKIEKDAEVEHQKQKCAQGYHKWEMRNKEEQAPYIRCEICWARAPQNIGMKP